MTPTMQTPSDQSLSGAVPDQGADRPSSDVVEWLHRLIGFPTVSRDSNLALIEHVKDFLSAQGITCRVLPNEEGNKANLWARIGPDRPGGVALSGHTDVVPVDGQDWDSDPFVMEERNDTLVGRGAADMKGFLACCLALVPRMQAAPLARPIDLCFSYDEEVGCRGVDGLIEYIATLENRPGLCLVGEPTGMDVVTAHKGKLAVECVVRGSIAHSSLAPRAANAVQAAARLVARIADMADAVEHDGPFDARYDVEHTTIHVGQLQGGQALNIVPDHCSFVFEFRHLPMDDPFVKLEELKSYGRELEAAMQKKAPDASITWNQLFSFPGLDMDEEDEAVTFMKGLAATNSTRRVAYGTEGGKFQQNAGIPTVICGPGHIDQAHKANEFAALSQLAEMEQLLGRLVERLCKEA